MLFREPTTDFRGGHRNTFVDCVIQDNGSDVSGIGVDIRGLTCNVTICNCNIADSGQGKQTVGVRIAPEVVDLQLDGNHFGGHKKDIEDERLDLAPHLEVSHE